MVFHQAVWLKKLHVESGQLGIFLEFLAMNGFCAIIQWRHNFFQFLKAEKFAFVARHIWANFGPDTKSGSRFIAKKRLFTILLNVGSYYYNIIE